MKTRLLFSPVMHHAACGLLAVLVCLPLLFPVLCPGDAPEWIQRAAGILLTVLLSWSFLLLLITAARAMLRLNNSRALYLLLQWCFLWGISFSLFSLLAVVADVEPPTEGNVPPAIQTTDTLYRAGDELNGPDTLVIHIDTEGQQAQTVAEIPNLSALERDHAELLKEYLERSPRWTGAEADDTFYSKPGHLVMVPPVTTGAPGMVHVSFRRLVGGDPLPSGYTVVKPGKAFPKEKESMTDIALDVGKDQYLLLVWRGTEHEETVHKALNAAISAVDSRLQPLLENPTRATMERMMKGRRNYPGETPEIRLLEPPAQEGTYQAEIYANPGEAGTLLLYIRHMETGKTLRLLNCPAAFSDRKDELFRHDIPGSIPDWLRESGNRELYELFPPRVPLFAVCTGKSHQYFGAAFEVWFLPTDERKPQRMLLRRCFNVHPYEKPTDVPLPPAEPVPTTAVGDSVKAPLPEPEPTTPRIPAVPNVPKPTTEQPDTPQTPRKDSVDDARELPLLDGEQESATPAVPNLPKHAAELPAALQPDVPQPPQSNTENDVNEQPADAQEPAEDTEATDGAPTSNETTDTDETPEPLPSVEEETPEPQPSETEDAQTPAPQSEDGVREEPETAA